MRPSFLLPVSYKWGDWKETGPYGSACTAWDYASILSCAGDIAGVRSKRCHYSQTSRPNFFHIQPLFSYGATFCCLGHIFWFKKGEIRLKNRNFEKPRENYPDNGSKNTHINFRKDSSMGNWKVRRKKNSLAQFGKSLKTNKNNFCIP